MLDPHKPYFLTAPTDPQEEGPVLQEMIGYILGKYPETADRVIPVIVERVQRVLPGAVPDALTRTLLSALPLPEVGSPARNDYHIARWTMLGEDADLLYLINKARELTPEQRVHGDQNNLGATTALWAIASISKNGERFKADILRLAGEDGSWLLHPTGF